MDAKVIIQDENGTTVYEEDETLYGDRPMIIMVKRDVDGKLVVDSFEPLEIDRHPNTLGEIGNRIVSFVEGK